MEFFEAVPSHDDLKEWFGDKKEGILVLEDLMSEGGDDKDILNLFTQYSHHLNVTVFYRCQDMLPKGKYAKTISRNAQYIIVLKNPRDKVTLRTLLIQMYANKSCCPVMEKYNRCTERPFGPRCTSCEQRQHTTRESLVTTRRVSSLVQNIDPIMDNPVNISNFNL